MPGSSTPGSLGGPLLGRPAPALEGKTLDGDSFRLADLRGKPVVVNFWATWCPPCRDEFPVLADAAARHATDGLEVVGVVFNDDPGAARDFAAQAGATWPSLVDPGKAHARDWKVIAPPQTFFIDRDGIVREVHIGQVREATEMDRLLATILP